MIEIPDENKTNILKINNDYNLKLIFSYLDYQYILKLIKINKKLQNKLGIKLENYKNKPNYPKFQEKIIENPIPYDGELALGLLGLAFCLTCIFFTYTLIYSILLVSKDTFNENNTKDNYESLVKTINIINACLFILVTTNIVGTFLFFFFLCKERDKSYKYGIKKIIKKILIILYNLIHIIFEILIIWKLVLSYEIKKEGTFWFIVLDYIFIFLNFFYILSIVAISYDYLKNIYNRKDADISYSITSLNNINIEDYHISEDFEKMKENEKREFLLNNYKNMTYNFTLEQKYLIISINKFRKENNLSKLFVHKVKRIPDYIMNEPAQIMMDSQNNFFKLSNNEYLFRYPIGEFENKFKNKDTNILSALLNEKLNYINIITKGNTEYVYICHLSILDSYNKTV